MRPEVTRSLLLIDADGTLRRLADSVAARCGWRVSAAPADASPAMLGDGETAAMLVHCPSPEAVEKARTLRSLRPGLPLLVCGEASLSVAALRAGATDFLATPLTPERLAKALLAASDRRRANGDLRSLSEKSSRPLGFDEMVGSTPAFRAALATAAQAARSRVAVLIEGEHGSGKETLARAIHASGPRRERPLIHVQCGLLFASHIESGLFGHERGAFPGAFERHVGKLEQADGSTLFLDGVEELSPDIQARLLHAIESGEVRRVGARGFKAVDIRLIAASSRPLEQEVEAGRFREDLYSRLNPVRVSIPPLRSRRADIPALTSHLLGRIAEQPGMRRLALTEEAMALLVAYGWPGNVRQLQDALLRAAARCQGQALGAEDFSRIALESSYNRRSDDHHLPDIGGASPAFANLPGVALYRPDGHLRSLEEIEGDIIRLAIGHYHGRMTEVARRLGIGRSTLYRKLGESGIDDAA